MLPTFETERLVVRPRSLDDLEACLAMDRDPEVTKFIPGPWRDPERHRAFVVDRITRDYGEGLGYWSIFERGNPDRFLGWILLIPDDGIGPEIEVGWRLVRETWGRGIGTEAARPVLAHAFATLALPRVVARIHPENRASRRLAEKLGLLHLGDREQDGESWADYALTHEEFSRRAG
jgi:Acetyltransferases, including N-acetylases of ribosomal proteins